MESENRQPPEDSPQDAHAIKEVISKVKSQGLFDQFRKECLADVDTKPAYNNLIQRVEKFVERFLNGQKWNTNVNKNQLRDALRRQLNNSGVMNIGVDRIIEQVVNPKILLGIKPKIDEAVCSYLGVDLKTRQEEQQKRKQEQQRLMLQQQQQLQQQHMQSLMSQNLKPEENFGSMTRIHPNPWSHATNGANFPGSPMAGMTNSVSNAAGVVNSAGGSYNPQAVGFGGIMPPFYTSGWAPGLQGMEGFNQTMQSVIPGQPMIPPFGNGGIAPTSANVSTFNSASPSVSNVNTSFSTSSLPAQATAVQTIPDFSKPPPGLPGAPILNSASSLGSSPVPGLPLQSSPVAPPGILPGSVGNMIRPPPPGSVPPPPGTVPVIALRSVPTTPTIPALISHTLSKVSKEELTPEKIAVFKTAAAFITKTVSNAQGTPGADLATMFSPRVLAEAMMAESGKPLTKHEIRAARRKERMKEFDRLKAEREKEEEEQRRRISKMISECREDSLSFKHNLMDVFKAAEDVSEDEEAFDMLIDAEELGNKHRQGVILSDDSKDEDEKEKPPTSQPGKKYNFAWDVDKDLGGLSDVTVSSIHTSDISSYEGLSSDSEEAVEPTADDEPEKEEADLKGEQLTEAVAEETTLICEENQLPEHVNSPEKPNASDSSLVNDTEVSKTPDHQFVEAEPSVSTAVSAYTQKPAKSAPAKPRKLVSLSYKYSDSDDDETREERKARIAKEKEERYLKRQQRRAEMEAKRKEREEERTRLREEKKKQKVQQEIGAEEIAAVESTAEISAPEDQNASMNSTEPETSSISTPRKRKNKAEMKEQLLQQKVLEKKAALRRQRTRNHRYTSDEFTSNFSEKKASNQSYTDPAVDSEEVVTFDGNLEIVEVTVDQECVVETIGEDMDTAKDELILQCRSPYSDISDRSMSDKSEDEQKLTVEMEEVSSDEDIEPAEKEIEDEVVKTFPSSVHESDSNDSWIQNQNVVSSLEGVNLVTTQFSSVTIPDDGNSLTPEDIKRKSPLTESNDLAQPGDTDDVCNSHIRSSTPPLSSNDEKSSRAAPSSLSDNEDRASQRSNGAISSHPSLPQEGEKVIADNVKDSAAEEGEMASPKEPVDIMGDMELEPVSDEDSPLDNLSIDESSDGEKEEGEEKDSDKEEDKSSRVTKVETPSKISDVVSKDDEASDEGEIKSDSDESVKAAVEEKERMANRKPIELVDFGEAEKRARGNRSFYPEVQQQDRGRSSRGITVSSHPPTAYRGGYTAWPQTDTSIHSQYSSGIRYSLSHEAISSSRMRSPVAAVFDGGESETSSHSRSSVRLRDDVPPPYPIDGVKRKQRSPASDQGASSLYKTLSPPSPVSSASSSRSRSYSSARSRSPSASRSGSSSSSLSSSRSSQKKKRLKRKKRSKRGSDDTEKAPSLKSQTSTSKLSGSERIVSPVKCSEVPSNPVISQSRERHLSSGHESISSDELPYFPDEEPPKASPKGASSRSPVKYSPSLSSTSSKSGQPKRKKKRESISSSELIYSPSRLKSPAHSSATSKDDDDNVSIERPPLSPGRSSISSDELPDYPIEDSDPSLMQQFSPHQPPLPSDLPPLPEDTDGFQPPLPQDSPPMLLDIQPPPPPIEDDDSRMQPLESQEVEEGEIDDSEKSLLVPTEFEEGEIEDTIEPAQINVAHGAAADPKVNFLPPLKQQVLLPNSVVVSSLSSQSLHVDSQLSVSLKPLMSNSTTAALHTPAIHSQILSSSDSLLSASHPSAFSNVVHQENDSSHKESEDTHHAGVSHHAKLQKAEKTTDVVETNQFGTNTSSAEHFCDSTLKSNSTSGSEAFGLNTFNSRVDSLKTVETIISDEVIVPVIDLHRKVEETKDKENVDVIVADTTSDVTKTKAEIAETETLSDLEVKIENNKNVLHAGSEVKNEGTGYSALQTPKDLTGNMSESMSLKIIKGIDNDMSLLDSDLQCEDRNVSQLRTDKSTTGSETVVVDSHLAVNFKGVENDVSQLCSETKLEDMKDAVLQSCSDTTNIEDTKDTVLLSSSDLNTKDRKVAVLQPSSDRTMEIMKDDMLQLWPVVTNRHTKSPSPQQSSETNIKENDPTVPQLSSEVSMEDLHVLTSLPESEVKNRDVENEVSHLDLELRNEDVEKTVSQCVSEVESESLVLAQSNVCVETENTKSAIISQSDSFITLVGNERVSESACISEACPVNSAKPVNTAEVEITEKIADLTKQSLLITIEESAHTLEVKSQIPSEPSLLREEIVSRPEEGKKENVHASHVSSESSLLCEDASCRPELKEDLVSSHTLESTTVPEESIPSQRGDSEEHSLDSSSMMRPGVKSPLPLTANSESESLHLNTQQSVKSHTVESTSSEISECDRICSSKETSAVSDISDSVLASGFSIVSSTVESYKVADSSLSSESIAQSTSSELVSDQTLKNTEVKPVHSAIQENISSVTSLLPEKNVLEETGHQSNSQSSAVSASSELISDKTLKNTEVKPVHIACDVIKDNSSSVTSLLPEKNVLEETGHQSNSESTAQSTSSELVSDQTLKNTEVKPVHIACDVIKDNSSSVTSLLPEKNVLEGKGHQSNSESTAQSTSSELVSDQTLKNTDAKAVHITCDATLENSFSETTLLSAKDTVGQTGLVAESPQSLVLSEKPISPSELSEANNAALKDQEHSTALSTPLMTDMLSTSQSEQAPVTSLDSKSELSKESVYSPQAATMPSPGQRSVSSEDTYETSSAGSITRSKRRLPEDSGNSSDTSAASNESLPKRRRRGVAAENDKSVLTPSSAPTSRPGTRLQHQQQQELSKPQTRGRSNSLPSNRVAKRKQENDETPPARKQKR